MDNDPRPIALDELLCEQQHRLRNMAAVIRSVSQRTAVHSLDFPDFQARFDGRLGAIVRAYTGLARTAANGVDLSEMISDALLENAPGATNWMVEGPPVRLSPSLTEMMALVVHELALEAAISGPLGQPGGSVAVQWQTSGPYNDLLHFRWAEEGPERRQISRGFTFVRELLERALPYQFDAETSIAMDAAVLEVKVAVKLVRAG